MLKITRIFLVIVLFFSLEEVNAAQIISNMADYKNGRFFIVVSGTVKADSQRVFAVLTDYNNLTKISPKIIESKVLRTENDVVIVRTIVKGCVWFFCKKVVNTQVTTTSGLTIDSVTLPAESSFKFAKMRWEIQENGSDTIVNYSAQIEPDFFVPPLIGAFFIKRSLLKEANDFVVNVEKLANINP